MRILRTVAILAALALATACGGGDTSGSSTPTPTATSSPSPTGSPADEAKITATNATVWTPADVTIKVGGKVEWEWEGSLPHNAAGADGTWKSGAVVGKGNFERTFPAAGTFVYYCEAHGTKDGQGMAGKITVV